MNSLFPSLASTSVNPDRLGAVRVLIVGNAGLCCPLLLLQEACESICAVNLPRLVWQAVGRRLFRTS